MSRLDGRGPWLSHWAWALWPRACGLEPVQFPGLALSCPGPGPVACPEAWAFGFGLARPGFWGTAWLSSRGPGPSGPWGGGLGAFGPEPNRFGGPGRCGPRAFRLWAQWPWPSVGLGTLSVQCLWVHLGPYRAISFWRCGVPVPPPPHPTPPPPQWGQQFGMWCVGGGRGGSRGGANSRASGRMRPEALARAPFGPSPVGPGPSALGPLVWPRRTAGRLAKASARARARSRPITKVYARPCRPPCVALVMVDGGMGGGGGPKPVRTPNFILNRIKSIRRRVSEL